MIKPTPTLIFTEEGTLPIFVFIFPIMTFYAVFMSSLFTVQARQLEQEADTKPVVASKIPVGSFRVEEERRINRALSRERSSVGGGRIVRERSMSRIPVFSTNSPSNNVGFNYSYNLRRIAVPLLFPRLHFIKQFSEMN